MRPLFAAVLAFVTTAVLGLFFVRINPPDWPPWVAAVETMLAWSVLVGLWLLAYSGHCRLRQHTHNRIALERRDIPVLYPRKEAGGGESATSS